jgi:SAM-dependent methyltransferase
MSCTEPEFWEQRYRANRMPWDQRGIPAALIEYLQRTSAKGGSALIPGCGSGYEVQAFQEFGWRSLAIDFSPAAIERARAVLGAQAGAVRLADFFTDELGGPFDLIYERTFLCSLPPERWPAYAQRMADLLRPGGRLVGIFAYGEESEPPPFPLTETIAAALFGSHFSLVEDRAIPSDQSLPLFAGKERWQTWQRK